jgi:hypothetical protein
VAFSLPRLCTAIGFGCTRSCGINRSRLKYRLWLIVLKRRKSWRTSFSTLAASPGL